MHWSFTLPFPFPFLNRKKEYLLKRRLRQLRCQVFLMRPIQSHASNCLLIMLLLHVQAARTSYRFSFKAEHCADLSWDLQYIYVIHFRLQYILVSSISIPQLLLLNNTSSYSIATSKTASIAHAPRWKNVWAAAAISLTLVMLVIKIYRIFQ